MIKIGVISDTHGRLRPEVCEALRECSVILHAGDINRQEILDRLAETAPVTAVRGNNDRQWAEHLPLTAETEIEGVRICMAHKKADLPKDLSGRDLVIYGHTHRYEEYRRGGQIFLNPGSCGPRRFNQEITMALVSAEGGRVTDVRKVVIPNMGKRTYQSRGNLHEDIERAVKEIQKGRSVDEIAAVLHMDRVLADQICRLYLTHPGVDADGIMTKMGL